MKRKLLFLSMFLGLSLILTGCGEKSNPVSTNGGAKEEKCERRRPAESPMSAIIFRKSWSKARSGSRL